MPDDKTAEEIADLIAESIGKKYFYDRYYGTNADGSGHFSGGGKEGRLVIDWRFEKTDTDK